jgi:hypothetical protein
MTSNLPSGSEFLPGISAEDDAELHAMDAAAPDCPAWRQLTEVTNKVPSLMYVLCSRKTHSLHMSCLLN